MAVFGNCVVLVTICNGLRLTFCCQPFMCVSCFPKSSPWINHIFSFLKNDWDGFGYKACCVLRRKKIATLQLTVKLLQMRSTLIQYYWWLTNCIWLQHLYVFDFQLNPIVNCVSESTNEVKKISQCWRIKHLLIHSPRRTRCEGYPYCTCPMLNSCGNWFNTGW
jgi:hypothetical protein